MTEPAFFSNGSTPLNSDTLLVTTKKVLGALGGGAAGATGQVIQYVSNPNTEGLQPSNTSAPALAYKKSGAGTLYQWNTTSLTWV